MQEVFDRIFVANEQGCQAGDHEWAVVHACKSPCHQRAVGYSKLLPNTHPNYLVLEKENDLFLNIIDPPAPLFMPPLFTHFLLFANRHWNANKSLLIHCNQGESRAPSLALLFLAKSRLAISNTSYSSAKNDFQILYPRYNPGKGIQIYFNKNWDNLGG
jgi:hypothetical protein